MTGFSIATSFFLVTEIPRTKTPAPAEAANKETGNNNIAAQTFTFRELATATRNFRQECLIGEGGFGRVYKGRLEKTGQVRKHCTCSFYLPFKALLKTSILLKKL